MPQTRNTAQKSKGALEAAVAPNPKNTNSLRPKTSNKRARDVDANDNSELEQPAVTKKSKSAGSNGKRQREVNNLPTESTLVLEPTAKKVKIVAVPSPQPLPPSTPRRSQRPRNPVKVTPQARIRRSKTEIKVAKDKSEAEKRRREQLTQDNHRKMLMMNIEEDINRAEAAAQVDRKFTDFEDDSGEEFVGYNDFLDSHSDSDSVDEGSLKDKNKALRERIKALEATALARDGGGQRKMHGGNKRSKMGNYASGRRPDCDSDNRAPGRKINGNRTHVEISTGGLTDSDVEDVNPYGASPSRPPTLTEDELTERAQSATRDFSRRNELVAAVESDEDKDYVPHPSLKKIAAEIPFPKRVKTTKQHTTNTPNTVETTAFGNRQRIQIEIVQPTATITKSSKPKRLSSNSVRLADLPEFAREGWRDKFLPTLYDKFFTSDRPFDAFSKDSDRLIALLQSVVKEVYPDVKYKVTVRDSIHYLAYNRVNEKKSLIGSSAISAVKRHIEGLEARGQSPKEWLRWARRIVDGPLFFEVPSPLNSPTDQKDPGYQYPTGRLLSPFIIGLTTSLLNFRKGSVSDNGYPKGLVAMVMAALERAVKHLSKPSDKILEFSKDNWGSTVNIYYDGFHGVNGVSESRWRELLRACSDHSNDGDESSFDADLSIMDNNRVLVFGFRSPQKPRL